MKIKTSELTSSQLSFAVCMIEMPRLVWGETIGLHWASNQVVVPEMNDPECYSPFTNWAQGGPIIEREWLDVTPWPNESDEGMRWQCTQHDSNNCTYFGPTPLIAAMRCYVASKLGDEVEVPDELVM